MNNHAAEVYDFTKSFGQSIARFDSLPESIKEDFARAMRRKCELDQWFNKHDLLEQEQR